MRGDEGKEQIAVSKARAREGAEAAFMPEEEASCGPRGGERVQLVLKWQAKNRFKGSIGD